MAYGEMLSSFCIFSTQVTELIRDIYPLEAIRMSSSFEPPLNPYAPGKGGVYGRKASNASHLPKVAWKGSSMRPCPSPTRLEFFQISEQLTRLLQYECNRVFVNHADSFVGRHLVQFLGEKDFSSPFTMGDTVKPESTISDISEKLLKPDIIGESDIMHGESASYVYGRDKFGEMRTNYFGEECIMCPEECFCIEEEEQAQEESSCHESESIPCIPEFMEKLLTRDEICNLLSLEDPSKQADYFRRILLTQHECYQSAAPTRYWICGTQKNCTATKSEYLNEVITDREMYLPTLLKCNTVIYDITRDPGQIEEARWALNGILQEFNTLYKKSVISFKKIKEVRKFILISSAMTWASSLKIKKKKAVSEKDLKNRRSHAMWLEHKHLEQEVLKAGEKFKDIFKTYVIWTGMVYGHEEERLNFLFELGFQNAGSLPVIGLGDNTVPLIHVTDLAMIVFYAMSMLNETPSYMFAIEKDAPTLRDITEQISRGLTTGNIFMWMQDDALPENVKLHEDTFVMLKTNLLINPVVVHEELALPWRYPDNIIGCMPDIVEEYLVARGLCPLRLIVLGPPASGKTTISKKLADVYGLQYVHPLEALLNYIAQLEEKQSRRDEMLGEEEMSRSLEDGHSESVESNENRSISLSEEENKAGEGVDGTMVTRTELDILLMSMKQNEGMPEDKFMVKILKQRLEEMKVLNHGYVLDGWPETYSQAEALFGEDDDNESVVSAEGGSEGSEEGGKKRAGSILSGSEQGDDETEAEGAWGESDMSKMLLPARIPTIDPSHIIHLEAKCDDLLFKILTRKQDLEGKNYSSVSLTRKMHAYMEQVDKGCEPFEFFDNNCMGKLMRLNVDRDPCPMLGSTIKTILDEIGAPRNKGAMCTYIREFELIRTIISKRDMDEEKKLQDEKDRIDQEYFTVTKNFMDQWINFKQQIIQIEDTCPHPTKLSMDEFISVKVMPLLVRSLIEYQNTKPKNYFAFFAEFFLSEYEHATGQAGGQLSPAEIARENRIFTRCVEALLEQCDLSQISLLPDAMAVVKKYKRFARADNSSASQKVDTCFRAPIDIEAIRKRVIGTPVEKAPDILEKEMLMLPEAEKSGIGIREVLEAFLITNPLWKDKLHLDCKGGGDICSRLSGDSLAQLWKITRSMSAEIRRLMEERQSCFGKPGGQQSLNSQSESTKSPEDESRGISVMSGSMSIVGNTLLKTGPHTSIVSDKSPIPSVEQKEDDVYPPSLGFSWQSASILRKGRTTC